MLTNPRGGVGVIMIMSMYTHACSTLRTIGAITIMAVHTHAEHCALFRIGLGTCKYTILRRCSEHRACVIAVVVMSRERGSLRRCFDVYVVACARIHARTRRHLVEPPLADWKQNARGASCVESAHASGDVRKYIEYFEGMACWLCEPCVLEIRSLLTHAR